MSDLKTRIQQAAETCVEANNNVKAVEKILEKSKLIQERAFSELTRLMDQEEK